MRSFARPTLKDVARLCGASEITVSRVMRGAPNISATMRMKVELAARQLNYAPNRLAGALASKRSHLLAVIVPSMTHAVFPELLDGIDSVLKQTPFRTVLGISHYDKQREAELIDDLLAWNPAGIALAGFEHTESARHRLETFHNPVFELMDTDGDPVDTALGVSQAQAGCMMAQHLTDRGYRRIGYVGAWNEKPERSRKRRLAFETRLEELGNPLSARVIRPEDSSMLLGKQACAELLRTHPDCDALFFANDDLAAGALMHCLSEGISVPDQLALAGFNGLPLTQALPLQITTIQTPRFEMGASAARVFLDRMNDSATLEENPDASSTKLTMPLTFIQGATT